MESFDLIDALFSTFVQSRILVVYVFHFPILKRLLFFGIFLREGKQYLKQLEPKLTVELMMKYVTGRFVPELNMSSGIEHTTAKMMSLL